MWIQEFQGRKTKMKDGRPVEWAKKEPDLHMALIYQVSLFQAPDKIHYQAWRNMITAVVDGFQQERSQLLSQEKAGYQKDISVPYKTKFWDKPERNNKGHRNVYGQYPLEWIGSDIGPPVSERDVKNKNDNADK